MTLAAKEDASIGLEAVITTILEKYFPNGIRPNSIIDINKLKHYYFEVTGVKEWASNIDIMSLLIRIGIAHGEKVFAVSFEGRKSLVGLIGRLISEGHRLFYFSEFYDKHADFLLAIHIFSSELLKTVLLRSLPFLYFSRSHFSTQSDVSVKSEMLRCFESACCLSHEQFKTKLPYVPIDKIKSVLAQNRDFIWVGTGTYTHISKVEIDGVEQQVIEQKIKTKIAEHGYAFFAELDVSKHLEINPELTETAIKNGLFQKCLSDRYEKRGNVITPKSKVLNSIDVLRTFCLSHKRLTVTQLLEYEEEIYGRTHSQSLLVAYDTMIRVDKEHFVSDSEISFDIEATDNALLLFVSKDVIPLKAVTSFSSFPYISGYPWNLYLLESYCKRFSRLFNCQCLSVNSRNVGAIFRRSSGFMDYIDVLANAVAASNVELDIKIVGDYLFENGYIAQRTSAVSKAVAKAIVLRERRV